MAPVFYQDRVCEHMCLRVGVHMCVTGQEEGCPQSSPPGFPGGMRPCSQQAGLLGSLLFPWEPSTALPLHHRRTGPRWGCCEEDVRAGGKVDGWVMEGSRRGGQDSKVPESTLPSLKGADSGILEL